MTLVISPIRNCSDLKAEIYRLQGIEEEKRSVLQKHFSSPGAIFSTIFSLFKSNTPEDKDSSLFNQDFVGMLSRIVLPFALNKTLFRKSNFVIKALVGLVSQKASHYISEDSVTGIWDKAKGLFSNLLHKEKKPAPSFKKIKKD